MKSLQFVMSFMVKVGFNYNLIGYNSILFLKGGGAFIYFITFYKCAKTLRIQQSE